MFEELTENKVKEILLAISNASNQDEMDIVLNDEIVRYTMLHRNILGHQASNGDASILKDKSQIALNVWIGSVEPALKNRSKELGISYKDEVMRISSSIVSPIRRR